jgi:hypothetical protein
MKAGAMEIERLTGDDRLFPVKAEVAKGEAIDPTWGFPESFVLQAMAKLDELADAGMSETTPLVMAYGNTNRSVRWYWVWNEDLTMLTTRPTETVVTTEWDGDSLWTNCDKHGTTWLKDKASGLSLSHRWFQTTMRDWRNYLNELLLNNERTQARQTLNTLKTYMGQYQRSFNEAERQIEAGEEQLANLGDPDWVETAWESWMDRLRNSAERNIEEGEEKRNAAKRDLAGLSPQVEEATSAWQAAQEAWQETQRV